ncbi:MAG: hypothetical protein AAF074_09855 [Pseudomonadota bacterium]
MALWRSNEPTEPIAEAIASSSERARFAMLQEADGRAGLRFASVVEIAPEVAARSLLLRSRIKDLRLKFQEDGNRAVSGFYGLVMLTVAVAIFGVLASAGSALSRTDGSTGLAISVAIGAVAAIVAAASRAVGLHQRYQALFRARWMMNRLLLALDHRLHDIALDVAAGGDEAALRDRLDETLGATLADFERAMEAFGDGHGSSLTPIALPRLPGLRGKP